MKILVTGGAGYIGSHEVKACLERKHKVVVIDNLSRGYQQVIDVLKKKFGSKKLTFYKEDLLNSRELRKILQKEKPDAVMHFAALCLVNESVEKPKLYFENNILSSLNLIDAMLTCGLNYLIFSSTCATYGSIKNPPVSENHKQIPDSPYGESKYIVERILNWFAKTKDLKYVILRYFNVTGSAKDGLIGDSKKPSVLLVQNAVRGALGIEKFQLTCSTNLKTRDGTPIRDYVNVEDLANAHLKALDYLIKTNKCDVFNIGTGKGNSVLEIIKKVKKVTGVSFEVNEGPKRQGESAQIYADISKAKKILGWHPQKTIEDSIKSLLKWYQKHPQGWEY